MRAAAGLAAGCAAWGRAPAALTLGASLAHRDGSGNRPRGARANFALSKFSIVNACWFAQVCTGFAQGLHRVCKITTGGMRENKTPGGVQTLCKLCANPVQTCANRVQTENKMVCSMQTEQTMSKHGTNPKIAHT